MAKDRIVSIISFSAIGVLTACCMLAAVITSHREEKTLMPSSSNNQTVTLIETFYGLGQELKARYLEVAHGSRKEDGQSKNGPVNKNTVKAVENAMRELLASDDSLEDVHPITKLDMDYVSASKEGMRLRQVRFIYPEVCEYEDNLDSDDSMYSEALKLCFSNREDYLNERINNQWELNAPLVIDGNEQLFNFKGPKDASIRLSPGHIILLTGEQLAAAITRSDGKQAQSGYINGWTNEQ